MIMAMLANRELAEVRDRLDAVPAEVVWNGDHTFANFIRTYVRNVLQIVSHFWPSDH